MGMLGKGSMCVPDVTAAGSISHGSAIPFPPSQIASPSSCTAGKKGRVFSIPSRHRLRQTPRIGTELMA
jgi:hypothetical protein